MYTFKGNTLCDACAADIMANLSIANIDPTDSNNYPHLLVEPDTNECQAYWDCVDFVPFVATVYSEWEMVGEAKYDFAACLRRDADNWSGVQDGEVDKYDTFTFHFPTAKQRDEFIKYVGGGGTVAEAV